MRTESGRNGLELLLVLAGAALFVLALGAVTGEMYPKWDGINYAKLAQKSFDAKLRAPFVYRLAVPFLARGISSLTEWDLLISFRLLVQVSTVLVLTLAYGAARRWGGDRSSAAFLSLCLGLTFHHVRFPLFFTTMVDVEAYPLILLSMFWIWEGHPLRAGWLGAIGLLFKEFLLLPLVVALVAAAAEARRARSWRAALGLVPVVSVGAAAFLLPRLLIEVRRSFQEIDPTDATTWSGLWELPTDPVRLLTMLVAYLGYFLPVLLLLTRPRLASLRAALAPYRLTLGLYLVLHLLLVVYGGRNVAVFVSYSLPVLVLLLIVLLRDGAPSRFELAYVLAALVVYNRLFVAIPDPNVDEEAYYVFLKFGYPAAMGWRLLELVGWIAGAILVRRLRPADTEGSRHADRGLEWHARQDSNLGPPD